MGRIETLFAVLILTLALTLILTGCSDNTCKPRVCGPKPTLENVWPNDDQRFWEYDFTMRGWSSTFPLFDTLYATEEEVPPLPTFDYIVGLLDNHPIGDDVNTDVGIYRMRFDGDSTSDYGVTAQALKDTLYIAGMAVSRDHRTTRGDIILGRAIPDRGGVQGLNVWPLNSAEDIASYPMLIHGGIWEKNDAWIGTYCEIDTNLCWKFLEEDLTVGSEFTHQLIPGLADNVFMHCKVLSMGNVRIGGLVYPNALECAYIVDYGVTWTDLPPGHTGYYRVYDYGVVVYAPEVGPIYSYERALVEAGNDESSGVGDKTLAMTDTGTPR
ncbi:MAG: hypothetical protein PVH52_06740 [bacterium]